jgi:hypothetical protein
VHAVYISDLWLYEAILIRRCGKKNTWKLLYHEERRGAASDSVKIMPESALVAVGLVEVGLVEVEAETAVVLSTRNLVMGDESYNASKKSANKHWGWRRKSLTSVNNPCIYYSRNFAKCCNVAQE